MIFSEVIDFQYDEIDIKKVKEYFKNLLNTDIEVRLRILDPRINVYDIYVDLNKDIINKIKETFPEIKIIEEKGFLKSKVIRIEYNGTGKQRFTIFNVKKDKVSTMIKLHDEEYERQLKFNKENGIVF